MGTGGESLHPNPRTMATTTCCFTALQPFTATGFVVQVAGIDADGAGIYHPTLKAALEYAHQANGNGFTCFVHLA